MQESIKQYIVEQIEEHHGLRIVDVVMMVFLKFGLVPKETEVIIENMIIDGYVRCIDYYCIDFDRWYGFLLTTKYSIEVYSKNGMKKIL